MAELSVRVVDDDLLEGLDWMLFEEDGDGQVTLVMAETWADQPLLTALTILGLADRKRRSSAAA